MSLRIASESRSGPAPHGGFSAPHEGFTAPHGALTQAGAIEPANALEIQTSRFGLITVDAERIITFPRGLLGFPDYSRYALIQAGEENYFFWLQCVDEAALAFVVTDPGTFFKDYEVPFKEETQVELEMTDPSMGQVFVICNKVGDMLTGNLLGPIVVNIANRRAQQVVLTEKRWTTRQPLMQLRAQVPLAKSA